MWCWFKSSSVNFFFYFSFLTVFFFFFSLPLTWVDWFWTVLNCVDKISGCKTHWQARLHFVLVLQKCSGNRSSIVAVIAVVWNRKPLLPFAARGMSMGLSHASSFVHTLPTKMHFQVLLRSLSDGCIVDKINQMVFVFPVRRIPLVTSLIWEKEKFGEESPYSFLFGDTHFAGGSIGLQREWPERDFLTHPLPRRRECEGARDERSPRGQRTGRP